MALRSGYMVHARRGGEHRSQSLGCSLTVSDHKNDLCVGRYRPESNARLEHRAEANTAFSRPAVRVTALQLHRGWSIGKAGY